jgi:uncharacterized membrane protein
MSAFFSQEQRERILKEIREAELDTSGEIRVHLENHCKGDAFLRGVELFGKLHMHQTAARNGVLFYLALKDKKFSIVADEGINQKVPSDFWNSIKDAMSRQFKEGHFVEGICEGVDAAGKQLKTHYPYHSSDKNELSDEISINEN